MGIEGQYRPPVVLNEANQRFEIPLHDKWAFLDYEWRNADLALTHTEVPAEFQGQGIGRELVTAALQFARREGRKVVAECPFVAAFVKRNPEYQDLIDPGDESELQLKRSA